jgi:hypothetical protein
MSSMQLGDCTGFQKRWAHLPKTPDADIQDSGIRDLFWNMAYWETIRDGGEVVIGRQVTSLIATDIEFR